MVDPPPLPARLSRPGVVAVVGSAVWALVALGLLVAWLVGARPLDLWFVTAVTGTAIGAFGFGVVAWQRSAARRGSRTAQRGAG